MVQIHLTYARHYWTGKLVAGANGPLFLLLLPWGDDGGPFCTSREHIHEWDDSGTAPWLTPIYAAHYGTILA